MKVLLFILRGFSHAFMTRRTVIHEAGYAVVGYLKKLRGESKLLKVSIILKKASWGMFFGAVGLKDLIRLGVMRMRSRISCCLIFSAP